MTQEKENHYIPLRLPLPRSVVYYAMTYNFTDRVSSLTELLNELLGAKSWTLGDLLAERPSASQQKGVYLLSRPSDSDDYVYAGRTNTKSILGRLQDHRRIPTKSDLRGMLRDRPDEPQKIDAYWVRWVHVEDDKSRKYFEHFVIAVLQPAWNRA